MQTFFCKLLAQTAMEVVPPRQEQSEQPCQGEKKENAMLSRVESSWSRHHQHPRKLRTKGVSFFTVTFSPPIQGRRSPFDLPAGVPFSFSSVSLG